MKKFTIAALAVVYIFSALVLLASYREMARPITQEESTVSFFPLPHVFSEFESTGKFEIPESEGATIEEKQKWALLRDVITCESASMWVVVERPGRGYDTGVCQISTYWHTVEASRKGYDLFVPSQNMLYCVHLFEQWYPAMQKGKWSPWYLTQSCWQDRQRMRTEQAKLF